MVPIRCILHPTDFSERSEYAFRLACSLARDHDGQVLVLHVLEPEIIGFGGMEAPPPPPNTVIRKEIKDKLLQIKGPDGLACKHRLEEGRPADQILRVAKESNCDMIVMGTHGRKGLGRLFLGSVAEEVTRKALSPVVIVKTPFLHGIDVPSPSPSKEECVQI